MVLYLVMLSGVARANLGPWKGSMRVEGTRMYRVEKVAEHFDVSAATIYRAVASDQLTILASAAIGAQAANDSLMITSMPADR